MPLPLTAELITTTSAVVIPVVSLAVGYLKLSMSNAIANMKLELIKDLNGTYIRHGMCDVRHGDIQNRLERVEQFEQTLLAKAAHV